MKKKIFIILSIILVLGLGLFFGIGAATGLFNKSASLEYKLGSDGSYYIVTGIGTVTSDNIVIPESHKNKPVKEIDSSAFDTCNSIQSVTIPDSVTSIGDYAFKDCRSLTSITIGNGVTSISYQAFNYCYKLRNVYYNGDITTWCNIEFGKDSSNPLYYAHNLYINNKPVTNLVIPNEVTTINKYAFYGATCLTSVTIHDGVTSIGNEAFRFCDKLVEVINKSRLKITRGSGDNGYVAYRALKVKTEGVSDIVNVNDYLFYTYNNVNYLIGYANNDAELVLPDNYNGQNYEIYRYAFYCCSNPTSITIHDGVTSIGDNAFSGCSLQSVTIADSVTSIGNYAFEDCTSLQSVTIPDSITVISGGAFSGCSSLQSVTIPDSITVIDGSAFNECSSLQNVTIPDSVTEIDGSAFYLCTSLQNVIIPDSVTWISESTFCYCYSLQRVIIPNSVTTISKDAFRCCYSLTSVTIGTRVTSIGENAFGGCGKLVEVINSSGLNITKGSEDNGYVAFNALNINTVGSSDIAKVNDYLFYTYDNVNYLVGYVGNDTELVLPNNYNGQNYEIYRYAFYWCKNLTSISFPNGITSIPKYVSAYCSGLTSISIPASVTSIGDSAFKGCYSLTTINFNGTKSQWDAVSKGSDWLTNYSGKYTVCCTDGEISKKGV